MRFLYILTAFVLFTFSIHAQNWSLVMPNDTLVYENQNNNQFFTVWVDSTEVIGSDTTYYMNRISPGEIIDTIPFDSSCAITQLTRDPVLIKRIDKPQFCGGTATKTDSNWIISYGLDHFVVYLNKQLGDQWVCDSVSNDSMTFVSKGTVFLDAYQIIDSIRTFYFKSRSLIVSKNHGVISNLDLTLNVSEHYNLIGVQNLGLGIVIPMKDDYFHFKVGDVFVRSVARVNSDGADVSINKHRITGKSVSGDTLIYHFPGYTEKYWPSMIPMINAFPNTLSATNTLYFDTSQYAHDVMVPVKVFAGSQGVIIKENSFYSYGYCLMDSVLVEFPIIGPFCQYRADTEPLLEGFGNFFETYTNQLIGYIIDGIPHGDTTSVLEIDYSKLIKIYPNPTRDVFTIATEKVNGISGLEMYDLQGRLIITKNFESELTLDVSEWSSGLYFAVVKDTDGTVLYREKIVVQKF